MIGRQPAFSGNTMRQPSALADLGQAQAFLVSGPDAGKFLHAQLASAVTALAVGTWQWSAWLDARGRVRVLCQLARCDAQRWLVVLRGGDATTTIAALRPFVFRLQVQFEVLTPCHRAVGSALPMHALACLDDHGYALGLDDRSIIISAHAATRDDTVANAFALADIRAGFPSLPDNALGTLLPPALSLYRLGAVATDKGCYPGQEIVSRLHHLGGHKHRLCRTSPNQPQRSGEIIQIDDKPIGRVLAVAENESLSVLRSDVADSDVALDVLETFPE